MDESEISAKEISMETGILSNDIISTLQYIGLIKYWKGKHVILKDQVNKLTFYSKFNSNFPNLIVQNIYLNIL